MSAPVEGREFAGLAGWRGGTKRLAGRVLHHGHETSACQFAGHTTDRGLAALEVLDTQIKPVLSNRFVQVQIDGLKQTAHGIPEIRTGQGNGNAPVDLLTMGGGELFLHLSGSSLVEGACCSHRLFVETRPLETFNQVSVHEERAFKSIRACGTPDGGLLATPPCVRLDADGVAAAPVSPCGPSRSRAASRGDKPHRDRRTAWRRRHHGRQRHLVDGAGQPHRG